MHHIDDQNLETIVAAAHHRKRMFVDAVRLIAPGSAAEQSTTMRCLTDLENGDLLRESVSGAIAALSDIISAELATERHGHRRVFDGHYDPELGAVGDVIDLPILTERGEELDRLMGLLRDFENARNYALDRLRAEQSIRRHL
ncbi:hypothetical protein KUV65_04060 [Maritalea mobilis]|uniref:hypothetical protein n=1 Tax=Maritalea mobilis TaxID=483324 RepID=UPI001C94E515|nr:hypothetical protein [Maritalea mobilis]MBY6200524.1 hypothetical protein [Maritalea mobilis]